MVSPRKSRKKSSCFSRTVTSTPERARRNPSITPAGPPPAMQHVVRSFMGCSWILFYPHGDRRPRYPLRASASKAKVFRRWNRPSLETSCPKGGIFTEHGMSVHSWPWEERDHEEPQDRRRVAP